MLSILKCPTQYDQHFFLPFFTFYAILCIPTTSVGLMVICTDWGHLGHFEVFLGHIVELAANEKLLAPSKHSWSRHMPFVSLCVANLREFVDCSRQETFFGPTVRKTIHIWEGTSLLAASASGCHL